MDYSKLVQLGLLQGSDQQDAARMGLFNILSQIGAASAPRTSPTPPPIDLAKAMNVYQSSMKNALTQGALRRQLKKESGLKQLFEAQPMDPVEARKIAAAKVDPLAETYAATGILSPDDDPQSYYQDKRQALMPDALKVAEQQTTMPDLLKAVTPSQRPLIQGLMKVDPELGIKTLISLRGKISDIPSSVREYNYYQTLKPEDQATFLRIKRATKTIDLADRVVIQSPTGETSTILKKGLPPGQQPELKKRQAISQQEGTAIGKKKGQALNIPGEEAKANYLIKMVEKLIEHPGLNQVVGIPSSLSGISTRAGVPFGDGANFMALQEQVTGAAFSEAFKSLKGGGQITEIEGQKATAALMRLTQLGQDPSVYREAAREFITQIKKGSELARKQAKNLGVKLPAAQTVTPKPVITERGGPRKMRRINSNEIESAKRAIARNPANRIDVIRRLREAGIQFNAEDLQ